MRGHFHGTTACLAALYRAERYAEILDVLKHETFWPYKRWAVKALGAMGKKAEAIRLAESSRGMWTSDADVDVLCEEMLLSSGLRRPSARHGVCDDRFGPNGLPSRAPSQSSAQLDHEPHQAVRGCFREADFDPLVPV